MKNIKRKGLFFIAIVLVGFTLIFFRNGEDPQHEETIKNSISVDNSTSLSKIKAHIKSMDKSHEIREDRGEVISEVLLGNAEGEVGVTTGEGGGFGPASFFVARDGKVYILDRNNSRILAGYGNNLKTIIDLKDQYVKGMNIGEDESMNLVIGNLDLRIEKYDKYGVKIEQDSVAKIKPDFLNAVDLRSLEDGLLVSSPRKIFKINNEGEVRELSGIPLDKSRSYEESSFIDASLDNEGNNIVLTFRAENDAPVAQKEIIGNYDAIHGVFPVEGGNIVVVAEEKIKDNKINALIYTLNPKGEVSDALRVSSQRHYIVDRPYQVSTDGCSASQIMVQNDKSIVKKYKLKCSR